MVSCAYTDIDIVGEPTLDELLAEPIVRLIMSRDGVEERHMRSEIERVRSAYDTLETVQ